MQRFAQELAEQAVVAVPALLLVAGRQQQVCTQEMLDHVLAVLATGQRIAQRRTQLLKHTGLYQELAAVRALLLVDFPAEERGKPRVACTEAFDERVCVQVPGQARCRLVQCNGPSLRSAMQRCDVGIAHCQSVVATQQFSRFLEVEMQRRWLDFQHLAMCPKPPQANSRCVARGNRHTESGCRHGEHLLDEVQ
ncbi:hypothetical protein D9M71_288860 [compost metagenome]